MTLRHTNITPPRFFTIDVTLAMPLPSGNPGFAMGLRSPRVDSRRPKDHFVDRNTVLQQYLGLEKVGLLKVWWYWLLKLLFIPIHGSVHAGLSTSISKILDGWQWRTDLS